VRGAGRVLRNFCLVCFCFIYGEEGVVLRGSRKVRISGRQEPCMPNAL
jgi:hypothetical protein